MEKARGLSDSAGRLSQPGLVCGPKVRGPGTETRVKSHEPETRLRARNKKKEHSLS